MENIDNVQGVFSIAVAAYLLLRMEKRLAALTEAINLLRHCQTCKVSPWSITLDAEVKEVSEE